MLGLIPPLFFAIMIATLFPGTAAAQSTSTTGSITLDMTIDSNPPAMIQINGLEDIELPDRGIGNFPERPTEYFCVYMDQDGTYSLEVTSKPFEAQTSTILLPFYIEISDRITAEITRFDSFDDPAGETYTRAGMTPSRVRNCQGVRESTWIVPALNNAPTEAGLFTTTMTLTVRPE
jgi:hypothetical protein